MREEKQLLLDEIEGNIKDRGSFVIISINAFGANNNHKFRRSVAQTGGFVEFVSKRMLVLAAKKAGIEIDRKSLEGQLSLVFAGEDAMETTKAVYDFRKEYKEQIQVVGGHIDGELCDADKMNQLSKLPGKQQMRAELLSVFQAPLVQTLATMNAVLTSVPYCLENKCKKES